jgi:DNA-directed RNA polymerase specialized sigma24 family protein
VLSKETDQLQDVQQRVQLARQLFIEQGEFIKSVVCYMTSNDEYTDDLVHDLFLFFVAKPIPSDTLNVRGYVYKVIHDRVIDWQRASVRYRTKIQRYREIISKTAAVLPLEGEQQENVQQILELIEKHL